MNQLEIVNYALSHLGEPKLANLTAGAHAAVDKVLVVYQPTLDDLLRSYRWNFARRTKTWTPTYVTPTVIAAHSTGEVKFTTGSAHGLASGSKVTVEDTKGADGTWKIVVLTTTTFYLVDSKYASTMVVGKYTVAPDHTYPYYISLSADCIKLRSCNNYEVDHLEGVDFAIEGRKILIGANEVDVVYTEAMVAGTDEAEFDQTFIELFSYKLAAALAKPITGADSQRDAMLGLFQNKLYEALRTNAFERKDKHPPRNGLNTADITRVYGEQY
jgi:hypothetical protein